MTQDSFVEARAVIRDIDARRCRETYLEKLSDLAREDFAQQRALISGDDARKFKDVFHEKHHRIHEECICSCESDCVGDATNIRKSTQEKA